MSPTLALASILRDGPVDSKAALVAMANQGFSAKQSRRAREALDVDVRRSGFGPRMLSMWRLPAAPTLKNKGGDAVTPTSPTKPRLSKMLCITLVSPSVKQSTRRPDRSDPQERESTQVRSPVRTETNSDDAILSDAEGRRVERRVALFVERGMSASEARRVAIETVHRRDRGTPDRRAIGSCVECQVRDGCKVVRPFGDVHECWIARHDGP
jgi:hypothetical protein